jgi:cysteinyl-tRNA synthetase
MVLPRAVRFKILRDDWGFRSAEIAAAVRQNVKIKNQRRATYNNLDKAGRVEEIVENMGRKVFRSLTLKKSTAKELQELEDQMNTVYLARVKHQIERMEPSPEDMATAMNEDLEDSGRSCPSCDEERLEKIDSQQVENAASGRGEPSRSQDGVASDEIRKRMVTWVEETSSDPLTESKPALISHKVPSTPSFTGRTLYDCSQESRFSVQSC